MSLVKHQLVFIYESIGFERMKIIQIECEMIISRKYNLSNGMTDSRFTELHRNKIQDIFKEFLLRLIDKIKANDKKFVSIESLYRGPLGTFLKAELQDKVVNINVN